MGVYRNSSRGVGLRTHWDPKPQKIIIAPPEYAQNLRPFKAPQSTKRKIILWQLEEYSENCHRANIENIVKHEQIATALFVLGIILKGPSTVDFRRGPRTTRSTRNLLDPTFGLEDNI